MKLTWSPVPGAASYQVFRGGTLIGTSTSPSFTPPTTTLNQLASYTVKAVGTTTSSASVALIAGPFQGTSVADKRGLTTYGYIQTTVVITSAASKTATGCWATYPTNSDSGQINPPAITNLCTQVITKHPAASTVASLITSVSGATATSPAFKTSLQAALTSAGIP
jgi:hypothetical protein